MSAGASAPGARACRERRRQPHRAEAGGRADRATAAVRQPPDRPPARVRPASLR